MHDSKMLGCCASSGIVDFHICLLKMHALVLLHASAYIVGMDLLANEAKF
jgi:hypothetical protein